MHPIFITTFNRESGKQNSLTPWIGDFGFFIMSYVQHFWVPLHFFLCFLRDFAVGFDFPEAAGHAKELQSLFEIFASASDMRMLEQVQELSDLILRGLGRVVGTPGLAGAMEIFGMGSGWFNNVTCLRCFLLVRIGSYIDIHGTQICLDQR